MPEKPSQQDVQSQIDDKRSELVEERGPDRIKDDIKRAHFKKTLDNLDSFMDDNYVALSAEDLDFPMELLSRADRQDARRIGKLLREEISVLEEEIRDREESESDVSSEAPEETEELAGAPVVEEPAKELAPDDEVPADKTVTEEPSSTTETLAGGIESGGSVSATVIKMINSANDSDGAFRAQIAANYGLEEFPSVEEDPSGRAFVKLLFTDKFAEVDADSSGDITRVHSGDVVTIENGRILVMTGAEAVAAGIEPTVFTSGQSVVSEGPSGSHEDQSESREVPWEQVQLDGTITILEDALTGTSPESYEVNTGDPDVSRRAGEFLNQQESIRLNEMQHAVEVETVGLWLDGIKGQNEEFSKKVNELREEMTGWSGYGHALEPSNLIASVGGTLGLDAKMGDEINYDLSADYLSMQRDVQNGVAILLRTMKGSERRGTRPMSLQDAWKSLAGNAEFESFAGSPDGRLFSSTVLEGREPTDSDQAQYLLRKANEIRGRIGPEQAEPYFRAVIKQFPGTEFAQQAEGLAMTGGEKAYQTFAEFGDIFLRLDMLAVMVASAGVGAAVRASTLGARGSALIAKYPRLAKVVPGVRVFQAAEGASALTKLGVGTVNFAFEMGKFGAYVTTAEHVGGRKAAYAVEMMCFFMPGLVHGFERAGQVTLEKAMQQEGAVALERFGQHASKEAGGPLVLRESLIQGMEREAAAAGQTVDRALLTATVDDALLAIGVKVEGSGTALVRRTASTKATGTLRKGASGELVLRESAGEVTLVAADEAAKLGTSFTEAIIGRSKAGFDRVMAFIRLDVGEALNAVRSKLTPNTEKLGTRFQDKWASMRQFLKEDWAATKWGSKRTINELVEGSKELADLFTQMPQFMKNIFRKPLARLRELLKNFRNRQSETALLEQRAAGSGEKAAGTGEKAALGGEKAAPRLAEETLEGFAQKMDGFKRLSSERLAKLESYSADELQAVIRNKRGLIDHYEKVLRGESKLGYYGEITGDHAGKLRETWRQLGALDAQASDPKFRKFVRTLITHSEAEIKAAEAKYASLGAEVGAGSAEKMAQNLESLNNVGSRLRSSSDIQSVLRDITRGQVESKYALFTGPSTNLQEKLATKAGRAEVKTLVAELLGVSENATRSEMSAAYRKIALTLHPDRLGQSSLSSAEREVADQLMKSLTGVNSNFLKTSAKWDTLFSVVAA